jgi:hypothetical protein
MWSAGLKVMNFQARTEPIRLFNISIFPSIVKDGLAVLQQRAAVQKPLKPALHMTLCYSAFFLFTSIGACSFDFKFKSLFGIPFKITRFIVK